MGRIGQWNLWVWEHPSWRVSAYYPSSSAARRAGIMSADPSDTWLVTQDGSERDEFMREHCTDRNANRA